MRNPDRSVREAADRAGSVQGARDLHGFRLGIRRRGFVHLVPEIEPVDEK